MSRRSGTVHLEDLLGRRVHDANGQVVGRIVEFRGERRRSGELEVIECLLGPGAFLERLAIVNRLIRRRAPKVIVARWDQIDLSRPHRPTLTCTRGQLKIEHPHSR